MLMNMVDKQGENFEEINTYTEIRSNLVIRTSLSKI